MKKIFCLSIILAVLLCSSVCALDNSQLLELRNKLFDESKDIKAVLANSKNPIVLNSMWDACIVAMSQLDAYFFMMGIFDAVSKDKWNEEAVNYLEIWLTKIRTTDDVNLRALEAFPSELDPVTQRHAQKLKEYFIDLNSIIEDNLSTIAKLKTSVQSGK